MIPSPINVEHFHKTVIENVKISKKQSVRLLDVRMSYCSFFKTLFDIQLPQHYDRILMVCNESKYLILEVLMEHFVQKRHIWPGGRNLNCLQDRQRGFGNTDQQSKLKLIIERVKNPFMPQSLM